MGQSIEKTIKNLKQAEKLILDAYYNLTHFEYSYLSSLLIDILPLIREVNRGLNEIYNTEIKMKGGDAQQNNFEKIGGTD